MVTLPAAQVRKHHRARKFGEVSFGQSKHGNSQIMADQMTFFDDGEPHDSLLQRGWVCSSTHP